MHHFGNEDVNRLHFVPKLCNRSGIDHRIRRFLVFFLRERTKPENFSDQTNKNNKLTLFSGQKQSLKGPYLLQYPYIRMHSLSSLAVYKKGAGTTIMLWGMGPGGWVFRRPSGGAKFLPWGAYKKHGRTQITQTYERTNENTRKCIFLWVLVSEKTILFFAKIGGMDGQKYHPREGRQGVGGAPPFKARGAVAPTYYPFSYPYLERKNQGLKKVHVIALFFYYC